MNFSYVSLPPIIPKAPAKPKSRCRCGVLTSGRTLAGEPQCVDCYAGLALNEPGDPHDN